MVFFFSLSLSLLLLLLLLSQRKTKLHVHIYYALKAIDKCGEERDETEALSTIIHSTISVVQAPQLLSDLAMITSSA